MVFTPLTPNPSAIAATTARSATKATNTTPPTEMLRAAQLDLESIIPWLHYLGFTLADITLLMAVARAEETRNIAGAAYLTKRPHPWVATPPTQIRSEPAPVSPRCR